MDKACLRQPCDSRAPVCDDKFLGFVRQPYGVVCKGRKAAATSKTKFSTCSFFLRLLYDFWRTQGCCEARKAAARLLQGTQGVHTTNVMACHPRNCLTKATRLL